MPKVFCIFQTDFSAEAAAERRRSHFSDSFLKASAQLCFGKAVLTHSAYGAGPILGNFLPRGAGSDAVIGIADSGIVLIAANAYIFHISIPLIYYLK